MKCFYHGSDLDGHCSGAIIKLKYPECEMYPFQYGDEPPWDDFHRGETVFVLDASFKREEMDHLSKITDLIWIDHHQSAIKEMSGLDLQGIHVTDKAGCELTWEFLNPKKEMPHAVHLLGRYDVWDHYHMDVTSFQYGMRVHDTDPTSDEALGLWELVFSEPEAVSRITSHGRAVWLYQIQLNERLAKSHACEVEWEGHLWCVANLPPALGGSMVLDSVYDPEKHSGMILFALGAGGDWYFSLRTEREDLDLSELASRYGGGGHKKAAGFTREIPPFNIKEVTDETPTD